MPPKIVPMRMAVKTIICMSPLAAKRSFLGNISGKMLYFDVLKKAAAAPMKKREINSIQIFLLAKPKSQYPEERQRLIDAEQLYL